VIQGRTDGKMIIKYQWSEDHAGGNNNLARM